MGIRKVPLPVGGVRFEVRAQVGAVEHRLRCETMAEARRRLAELKQQSKDLRGKSRLDRHRQRLGLPGVSEATLAQLVERAVTSPDFVLRSEASTARDRLVWELLLAHFGSERLVHSVTTEGMEQFRASLFKDSAPAPYVRTYRLKTGETRTREQQSPRARPRTASTVNKLMGLVHSLFARAVRWGYTISNPCERLQRLPADPPPERVLTPREEQRILQGIGETVSIVVQRRKRGPMPLTIELVPREHREDLEEWFVFNLDCGTRTYCETGTVCWGDVDWSRRRVTIRTAKRDRRRVRMVEDNRVVGLTERCLSLLRRRHERLSAGSNLASLSGSDPLKQEPIFGDDKTRGRRFIRLCERLGIGGVTPYTCRHTYATRLLAATGRLDLVQRSLGHSSVTTSERYLHLGDEAVDEGARALERFQARGASTVAGSAVS